MTTIKFKEVGFKKTKNSKCVVCGKRGSITKYFYQTINPYTNKTYNQIMQEELKSCNEWMQASFVHNKCAKK